MPNLSDCIIRDMVCDMMDFVCDTFPEADVRVAIYVVDRDNNKAYTFNLYEKTIEAT